MKKLKVAASKVKSKHRRHRQRLGHIEKSKNLDETIELIENNSTLTDSNNPSPFLSRTGSILSKILILLAYLLLGVSFIEIIFIPIGDRVSRRYAWNTHEPHVLSLLILMGLSASCGILFTVYLLFLQLKQIKSGNVTWLILILSGICGIFCFITFIYSISQFLAVRSLFGSKFLKLLMNYKNNHHEKVTMDRIQIEFQCCGHLSVENWDLVSVNTGLGEGFIPFSCCNPAALRPCIHENTTPEKLTIYKRGCRAAMQDYYGFLINFVIWASGSCAVFQVSIFVILYMMLRQA